jgi:hypothetical protein
MSHRVRACYNSRFTEVEADRQEVKMCFNVLLTASVIAAVATSVALALPPPGTDLNSPVHFWFEKQYNLRGERCCDVSDGHILEDKDVRTRAGGYEVQIEGKWYPIRPEVMRDPVRGGANPTGHPIVWYTRTITIKPGLVISCFAPGTLL